MTSGMVIQGTDWCVCVKAAELEKYSSFCAWKDLKCLRRGSHVRGKTKPRMVIVLLLHGHGIYHIHLWDCVVIWLALV